MKPFKILLYVLVGSLIACNQPLPIKKFDATKMWKQPHYQSLQELRTESISKNLNAAQHYGVLEAAFGNYERNQFIFDSVEIIRNFTNYGLDTSIYHFQPQEALKELTKLAKSTNLVLINEAHHRPEHRVFTQQLIEQLYKQGYRYLALEGLHQRDSLIQKRKFPNEKSGVYITDFNYGNLIRKAFELGMKVISYDAYAPGLGVRDSLQAANIYAKSFAQNAAAKVVVHAGYGHICQQPFGNSRPMGVVLSELTESDPLVIDQTTTMEHQLESQKSDSYEYITTENNITQAVVLKNKGQLWNVSSVYDACVIHPKLKLENHRATWLQYGNRKTYFLPSEIRKAKYMGQLIKVYLQNEPSDAIPIDQFELKDLDMPIIVPSGSYRIEIYDAHYMLQLSVEHDFE